MSASKRATLAWAQFVSRRVELSLRASLCVCKRKVGAFLQKEKEPRWKSGRTQQVRAVFALSWACSLLALVADFPLFSRRRHLTELFIHSSRRFKCALRRAYNDTPGSCEVRASSARNAEGQQQQKERQERLLAASRQRRLLSCAKQQARGALWLCAAAGAAKDAIN